MGDLLSNLIKLCSDLKTLILNLYVVNCDNKFSCEINFDRFIRALLS